MNTSNATALAVQAPPFSMKAACLGFVASTAAMTMIMVLVGNLY